MTERRERLRPTWSSLIPRTHRSFSPGHEPLDSRGAHGRDTRQHEYYEMAYIHLYYCKGGRVFIRTLAPRSLRATDHYHAIQMMTLLAWGCEIVLLRMAEHFPGVLR